MMICSSVHVFTQFMRGREAPNGLKNASTRSIQKSHFLPALRRWVTVQVLVVVIIIVIICAPSPPSAFTSGCIVSGLWLLSNERSTMAGDTGSSHTGGTALLWKLSWLVWEARLCRGGPALPPPFLVPVTDFHTPRTSHLSAFPVSAHWQNKNIPKQGENQSNERKPGHTHTHAHRHYS